MRHLCSAAALALVATAAQAHFGMIIPDAAMVSQTDGREVALTISFSHPFEAAGMTLARPAAFGVVHDGAATDLRDRLAPAEVMGSEGFTLEHPLERPGVHVFHMSPEPYWEPEEDAFIVHHTKTYVAAYDDDAGWDAMVGLPIEIEPLTRPFGLWTGNLFQGVVRLDGEPVPFAEVEVEHFSGDANAAPSDLMITQTIRADANGVFSYAAPAAGWWGFAALETAEETREHEGVAKPVEIGAVIWVRFEPWPAD
jgi:cobalt/nickel transport protein